MSSKHISQVKRPSVEATEATEAAEKGSHRPRRVGSDRHTCRRGGPLRATGLRASTTERFEEPAALAQQRR